MAQPTLSQPIKPHPHNPSSRDYPIYPLTNFPLLTVLSCPVLSCPALGAEELSAQAMHAIGVDPSEAIATTTTDSTAGGGGAAASSSSSSSSSSSRQQRCRTPPVALEASLSHIHAPCQLFFGTHWCYVFLRLHHTLFTRLAAARDMAAAAAAQAGGLGGEKDKDKGSANGAAASSSSSSSSVSTGMSRPHLLISLFTQSHFPILTPSLTHSSLFTHPLIIIHSLSHPNRWFVFPRRDVGGRGGDGRGGRQQHRRQRLPHKGTNRHT